MRKLLLPAAIGVALTGCGGYDANELKSSTGRFTPASSYVELDGGKPASGSVTRTENGVKTLEFSVKDGKPDGKWIGHDAKGNLTEELELRNGELTGSSTVYCAGAEKRPAQTFVVKGGQRTDTTFDCATGFSLRQIVKIDAPGEPGHRNTVGEQKAWQIVEGKQVLRGVEHYASDGSGKRDGVSEVYTAAGEMAEKKTWKNGELNGRAEEYVQLKDGTSRLYKVANYVDNRQDGEQITYFLPPWPEGTVKQRQVYKDQQETLLTTFTYQKAEVYDRTTGDDNWQLINLLKGQSGRGAAQVDDLPGLEYLLSNNKIDLNAPIDLHGNLPVHFIAENAYDLLVKLGADANKQAFNGQNRLDRCLTNDINCSAEHVLKLAAGPQGKQVDQFGSTPLHLLCRSGTFMSFRENGAADEGLLALASGQDVNAKDYQGKTALHYCMRKNPQLVDGLVAAGANLDAADLAGITPMHSIFLRGAELEQITDHGYQVGWNVESVERAGRLMSHSKFRFDAPFPGFQQGLKQVMIEQGDAQSAMAADRVTPKA